MTFFLAGKDTSSSTAGVIFYALANNTDVLSKIVAEINSFDNLKFENLAEMTYTTAVIKETLRMWPVVAFSAPRLTQKEIKIG